MLVSEFLEHHGVKGMHWGVRRDRGGSSSDRRASATAYNQYVDKAVAKSMQTGPISEEEYAKLSKKGESFVAGTNLSRVTQNQANIIRGVTFVSRLKEDTDFYRAAIPAGLISPEKGAGQRKYRDTYEVNFMTTKKLTLPSEKARVDAFTEILSKPVVRVPGHPEPMTGREYLSKLGYGKEIEALNNHEAGLKFYKSFVIGQGYGNDPLNAPYFETLKRKGYNALSDDQNKGTFTKAPLILLDASGTTTVSSVRKLSASEINAAQRRLASKNPGLS